MRRFAAIAAVLLPALGAAPAFAAPAATAPPPLRAKLTSCATGPDAGDRFAVFTGSMPRLGRAHHLEMRFDLLQRRPGDSGFQRVAVPKLGVWEHSLPGVAGLILDRRVNALAAPAAYRARVRFRWVAASGAVLHRARRTTPVCVQPDPRPDLVTAGVKVSPTTDPRVFRYEVGVRNAGRGDAVPIFAVSLSVNGEALAPQTLEGLPAGMANPAVFSGPPCRPGTVLDFAVDVRGDVEEAIETNNAGRRECPTRA